MVDPLTTNGCAGAGAGDMTIPVIWFTAACMTITGSRRPPVFPSAQAIATESGVTASGSTGKDCP